MRILLNIILASSIVVWLTTTVFVSVSFIFNYHNQTLMDVCGYSFGSMLFFGFEKMIVTENKTKDSFKALFNKEARMEKRRLRKENKGKGCGCKK